MNTSPSGASFNVPSGVLTALEKLQKQDRLRSLQTTPLGMIDFTSNDYLGLKLKSALQKQSILPSGSGGSRLLGGNTPAHEAVEAFASDWFQADSALLFNSGYDANIGVLSSLPRKNDTIIYDVRCHASLKDGIRLSLARKIPYRSIQDLASKLSRLEGHVYIVTEALYSMDGDWCPLEEIVQLKKSRKDTWIILDESHSTGISGQDGSGLASALNLSENILIRIHTFGKACGIAGAVVLAPMPIRDYLINYARTFIYTTAMPPFLAENILKNLKITRDSDFERQELYSKIKFWNKISGKNFNSPIIPWLIAGNSKCKEIAKQMQHKGFDVRAILSPSVPAGKERIRIILHVFNTDNELLSLYENLSMLNAE